MGSAKKKSDVQKQLSDGARLLSIGEVSKIRADLLRWYDRHRRVLPWRAMPGNIADPYHVWLSEIMLQQTVVAAVIPYFVKFVENWPSVHDLANAPNEKVMNEWAGLGYYARARNLHKCAKEVSENLDGRFPDDEVALKKLPGIGDYTAAAVTAIAFDKPAVVVDGNVERVVARYFAVTEPLPGSKKQLKALAAVLAEGRTDRPGDFAQATMDLGATVCTPKSPLCGSCPLAKGCAAKSKGIAADLPYKTLKGDKPFKMGHVYWIEDGQGRVLVERRPEKGMLGGMVGLPVSSWESDEKKIAKPTFLKGKKATVPAGKPEIFHSFTHFDLRLTGRTLLIPAKISCDNMFWVERKEMQKLGFPTLFKKFVRLMLEYEKAG